MEERKKLGRKKKKIMIIVGILLVLFVGIIIPIGVSNMIYEGNFNTRFETVSWMGRSIAEFDGLKAQRQVFQSNDRQRLVGYTYYKEGTDPKAVLIIAHGLGGGGHNSYLDIADYFTTQGYLVFAYDATGNDESAGDSVEGIPQGVIDLDYAIRFIRNHKQFGDLPIMLFGHSWGAYSTGSVLNVHPDIEAVVMVAGFNRSIDMIEEEGKRMAGDAVSIFVPYLSMIERIKFGEYAKYSCVTGFEQSNADVMLIHSVDDGMVSFANQYQMFYEKYSHDPRFTFIAYEDRGHNDVYYSDAARQYKEKLNKEFATFTQNLDTELTPAIKKEYMEEHLDKGQLFNLDTELLEKIARFYENSLN